MAARPWSRAERRVVISGFFGRLAIALEPLIAAIFFAALPIALIVRKQEIGPIVAPIFGGAALLFAAYATYLMISPVRALIETFSPIYIVDGYVRYRRELRDEVWSAFVSVLDADRDTLGEWPLREWPDTIRGRTLWPAMVEFSTFGGIHRIDGRATGVLPAEMASLGIGISQAEAARRNLSH